MDVSFGNKNNKNGIEKTKWKEYNEIH
jgi:hypothetical protein